MLQSAIKRTTAQSRVDSTLTHLRQEWQEATDGTSLLETDANMGLVLADLINGIGLGTRDQCQILGNDLYQELKDFLYSPKKS